MIKKRAPSKKKKAENFEYQVNIVFDSRDRIYIARVPELENCHTHGDTPEEALANAKEAIELWVETARERKMPIPEPLSLRKFSGKFVVRTQEELHASLAREALRSGKSMNELAVELLSKGLKRVS
jgi:predicted RNase H-like HicB family nuclease